MEEAISDRQHCPKLRVSYLASAQRKRNILYHPTFISLTSAYNSPERSDILWITAVRLDLSQILNEQLS